MEMISLLQTACLGTWLPASFRKLDLVPDLASVW